MSFWSFLVALLFSTHVYGFKMDGSVMMFSSLEGFRSALSDFDNLLVEFCDSTLDICQSCRRQFNSATSILTQREPGMGFARINFSGAEEIHSFYNIRKLPSIILFRKNKRHKTFDSHLVSDLIASWASKVGNPKCRALATKEEVDSFIQRYPVSVISYEASPEHSSYLRSLSSSFPSVYLGVVSNKSVADEVGEMFPSVVIRKSFDERRHVTQEQLTQDKLKVWIETFSQPLVAKATSESLGSLFVNRDMESVYIYLNRDYDDEIDEHGRILNDLRLVAKDFRGRTIFVYIPESLAKTLMIKLRIVPEDLPTTVLYRVKNEMSNTFRLFGEITEASVRNQLESYFNGTLRPTIRSLPVPGKTGPVQELVGLNFNEVVLDDYFDVLVLFYSPYCNSDDPCQEFFDTVKKLGELYQDSQTVKITQIDLTQNDIDIHVNIESLPTFVLFPATYKNKRLIYFGSPDFKSVSRFVYENYVLETPPPRPTPIDFRPEPVEAAHTNIHIEL